MLIINNTPQHYEQEKKKKNNLKGIISTFYTSNSGVFIEILSYFVMYKEI